VIAATPTVAVDGVNGPVQVVVVREAALVRAQLTRLTEAG
jgi:replicative superfamily II helicase